MFEKCVFRAYRVDKETLTSAEQTDMLGRFVDGSFATDVLPYVHARLSHGRHALRASADPREVLQASIAYTKSEAFHSSWRKSPPIERAYRAFVRVGVDDSVLAEAYALTYCFCNDKKEAIEAVFPNDGVPKAMMRRQV